MKKTMSEIDIFSTINVSEPEDKAPTITLINDKNNQKIVLQGACLEGQYRVKKNYILLLTENCPFEEALHIYLLDKDLAVKDKLTLSQIYTPGVLANVTIEQADQLSFTFFSQQEKWVLTIYDIPKFLWRGNRLPVQRSRPIFCKSYLLLTDVKSL